MTGMDQFLAQNYGTAPQATEPSAEDVEKVAQAEFFLKLAATNGVDLNTLNDGQISTLWESTFTKSAEGEKEEEPKEEKKDEEVEKAKAEHEKAKEAQAKLAEDDEAGRRMARSYVDELKKIAEAGGLDFLKTGAAAEQSQEAPAASASMSGSAMDNLSAKVAVEKAASAGYDIDEAAQRITAVLTLGAGESEKIAHVSDFESAVDVRSSELLELAGYPIDWGNTPFAKEAGRAGDAWQAAKGHAGKAWQTAKDVATAKGMREHLHEASEASKRLRSLKQEGTAHHRNPFQDKAIKDVERKAIASHLGRAGGHAAGYAAAAGGTGGAAYAGGKKLLGKKEGEKTSSVSFDVAAGELAVEKAAEAGWNGDEARDRLNALFTLGAEGDPAQSEKVASTQTAEQALGVRACELLEMVGYPINW